MRPAGALSVIVITAACCLACIRSSNGAVPSRAVARSHAEPSAAQAEPQPDLPEDEMDRLRKTGVYDCNGNGIPDEEDIRLGFAQDVNNNGQIDECDSDDFVAENAWTGGRWWRAADVPDSVYFSVVNEAASLVTLRYTVPPSGADVLLTVCDSAGTLLGTLVNRHQANGPYSIAWDRRLRGRPLPPGIYRFRLYALGRQLERRMGWRNWP